MTIQFSIVIPTFNDLGRLQQSLESALCQTLPCEVVVVDDGSRDGTEPYVRNLKKPVVYYRHPVPLGYAESVNAGSELARGNWIVLLNDSNSFQHNYLERLAEAMMLYPQAAIAVGEEISNLHEIPETAQVMCVPQEDIHYQMLSHHLPWEHTTPVAFRRDAFLRSGGWQSGCSYTQETVDAWVRIAQYGDAVFVKFPGWDRPSVLEMKAMPEPVMTLAPNPWADLERQYQMTENIGAKHYQWLANSPSVQMIRKFHWGLMGLKNSWFPGVEDVVPSLSMETAEARNSVETQPSLAGVFPPKAFSKTL